MLKKHAVIIIPGLGDGQRIISFFVRDWFKRFDVVPIIHVFPWKENGKTLEEKQNNLLRSFDTVSSRFEKTSIMGISGGGSAGVHVLKHRSSLHRFINNCGRVREGENVFPTLEQAGRLHPTFIQSVLEAQKDLEKMSPKLFRKVLTIRPRFGDEVVPPKTVYIKGARNINVPVAEHLIGIGYSLLFPQQIIEFLKS